MGKIGVKRHQVTLETRASTVDDFGDEVTTYTTLASPVWASVESLKGVERLAAQAIRAEVSHKVTIFWSPDVSEIGPEDRVLLGSRVFDITSAINTDEANQEIEMICVERL